MKKTVTYLALIALLITSVFFAVSCGIDSSSLGASASVSQPSEDTTAEEADVTDEYTEDEFSEDQLENDLQDEEVQDTDAEIYTYILNTNTKKFHYDWCRSVGQMKDKNKLEMEATRDEVIARGYDPCGNCKP